MPRYSLLFGLSYSRSIVKVIDFGTRGDLTIERPEKGYRDQTGKYQRGRKQRQHQKVSRIPVHSLALLGLTCWSVVI